jgi:SMI1 / KNR4 family (SUKH-1)
MLSRDFLLEFKKATELNWSRQSINPAVYGFQFQRGTRWNPGLSTAEITEYENLLGVQFPLDFRAFLQVMNGTDIPTLNVYGYSGEPHRKSVGVYSYPRDLQIVEQCIEDVHESRSEIAADLREQGFELPPQAGLVPIFGHRYVVCASNPDCNFVLSIVVNDVDAIVYGNSLQEYLEREFLPRS